MADLIDTKAMLASLVGVRADFTELAERFKVLASRQAEITNVLCGETDWEFETRKEYGASIRFTDDNYVEALTNAISKRDPICQMESLIKLIDKLGDTISSCETKIDKIKERMSLQRKQDPDYKNSNEYKVSMKMKEKLNSNALVLIDRYYLIIKLFYKARKVWLKRMTGLTERLVFKCKANEYLVRNKIKDSVTDQKRYFDDIINLDNQLTIHGR